MRVKMLRSLKHDSSRQPMHEGGVYDVSESEADALARKGLCEKLPDPPKPALAPPRPKAEPVGPEAAKVPAPAQNGKPKADEKKPEGDEKKPDEKK